MGAGQKAPVRTGGQNQRGCQAGADPSLAAGQFKSDGGARQKALGVTNWVPANAFTANATTKIPYFPDDLRFSAWHLRRNPGEASDSASFLPK
jgi:hypothetical protein